MTGRNTAFQKWFIEVKQENVELKKQFDKEKKELTVVKNFQKKLEDEVGDLKKRLESASELIYSFEPMLDRLSKLSNEDLERFEAQEHEKKENEEIIAENPITDISEVFKVNKKK